MGSGARAEPLRALPWRLALLRRAIAKGRYVIDAEALADRLLSSGVLA